MLNPPTSTFNNDRIPSANDIQIPSELLKNPGNSAPPVGRSGSSSIRQVEPHPHLSNNNNNNNESNADVDEELWKSVESVEHLSLTEQQECAKGEKRCAQNSENIRKRYSKDDPAAQQKLYYFDNASRCYQAARKETDLSKAFYFDKAAHHFEKACMHFHNKTNANSDNELDDDIVKHFTNAAKTYLSLATINSYPNPTSGNSLKEAANLDAMIAKKLMSAASGKQAINPDAIKHYKSAINFYLTAAGEENQEASKCFSDAAYLLRLVGDASLSSKPKMSQITPQLERATQLVKKGSQLSSARNNND